METPETRPPLGHPAQQGWKTPNPKEAKRLIAAQLLPRFAGSDENFSQLVDDVEAATTRFEQLRETHEHIGFGSIGTTRLERQRYQELAGRPNSIGQYIRYLGVIANFTLDHPKRFGKIDKLACDIGGIAQYGNWENTGAFYDLEYGIPSQLKRLDPDVRIRVYDRMPRDEEHELDGVEFSDETPRNYILMPRFTEPGSTEFRVAWFRRRRAMVDIWSEDQVSKSDATAEGRWAVRPIELYKESAAVVVVSQLAPELREALFELCSQPDFDDEGNANYARAASLLGPQFERAAREGVGVTRDILPVGVHGVAKILKSGRGMAESLKE